MRKTTGRVVKSSTWRETPPILHITVCLPVLGSTTASTTDSSDVTWVKQVPGIIKEEEYME